MRRRQLVSFSLVLGAATGVVASSPWPRGALLGLTVILASVGISIVGFDAAAQVLCSRLLGGIPDDIRRAGGGAVRGGARGGAGAVAVTDSPDARPRGGARPATRVVHRPRIIGVRGFIVRPAIADGTPRLWSQTVSVCWEGPELMAAHVAREFFGEPARDHFAPRPGCDCGIHVVHDPSSSWIAHSGTVLAAVVCDGVMIPHGSEGLRVERARIVAVAPWGDTVYERLYGGERHPLSIEAIAAHYGVPAVRRDYLIAYACEVTGGAPYVAP